MIKWVYSIFVPAIYSFLYSCNTTKPENNNEFNENTSISKTKSLENFSNTNSITKYNIIFINIEKNFFYSNCQLVMQDAKYLKNLTEIPISSQMYIDFCNAKLNITDKEKNKKALLSIEKYENLSKNLYKNSFVSKLKQELITTNTKNDIDLLEKISNSAPLNKSNADVKSKTKHLTNNDSTTYNPILINTPKNTHDYKEEIPEMPNKNQIKPIEDKNKTDKILTADDKLTPITTNSNVKEIKTNIEPSNNSSKLISDAKKASNRGEYQEALVILDSIIEKTDKIKRLRKDITEQHVKSLRLKVTQIYNSSSKETDKIKKKEALVKCKEILDLIIQKYPETTTRSSVDRNLRMIINEIGTL